MWKGEQMEVIFFYKNGKTEVVPDVTQIEDYASDVVIITRKNNYNHTAYEVGILKNLIQSMKIRYFQEG